MSSSARVRSCAFWCSRRSEASALECVRRDVYSANGERGSSVLGGGKGKGERKGRRTGLLFALKGGCRERFGAVCNVCSAPNWFFLFVPYTSTMGRTLETRDLLLARCDLLGRVADGGFEAGFFLLRESDVCRADFRALCVRESCGSGEMGKEDSQFCAAYGPHRVSFYTPRLFSYTHSGIRQAPHPSRHSTPVLRIHLHSALTN